MRRALVIFLLAGCGGPPTLAEGVLGEWSGAALVHSEPREEFGYPLRLQLYDTGGRVGLSGPCQDGSGAVLLSGQGSTASWSGTLVCSQFPRPDCPYNTLILSELSVRLSAQPAIELRGIGSLRGCGTAYVASFYGYATPSP